jgi:hypothetical protein
MQPPPPPAPDQGILSGASRPFFLTQPAVFTFVLWGIVSACFFMALASAAGTAGDRAVSFTIPSFLNLLVAAIVFFLAATALCLIAWFDVMAQFRAFSIAGAFVCAALASTLVFADFTMYNGGRLSGYGYLYLLRCEAYPDECPTAAEYTEFLTGLRSEYYYGLCNGDNDCRVSWYISLRVADALASVSVFFTFWIIGQAFLLYCLVKGSTWQAEKARWLALTGQA